MALKNINDDPSFNPSCSWGLGVSTAAGPGGRSRGREQEGGRCEHTLLHLPLGGTGAQ